MLRHERRHDLLFVTRDSEMGKQLRHIHGLESLQSMLWIEEGHAFAEASAVMKAANYLGGFWSLLAGLASIFPPFILNPLYRIIARHRRRLSSNPRVCPTLAPEQRHRFLQ
jgi:predicted DCC family thiol-disulfide oxidoreductase YuxK